MENRWRQIEDLYHAAKEQPTDRRADFLRRRCGPDGELHREVESLLVRDAQSGGALDQPAWDGLESLLNTVIPGGEAADAPIPDGTEIGPYRITGLLGAGGMGRVYRAQDTRLGRVVAIKVSKTRFSERFEREARAIAALNHSNICQLYDVGPNFLIMEFVEGAPVAGGAGIRKIISIAVQIAEGLAAAHAAGIVHRDLKPDNVLLSRTGHVKIVDFGLAMVAGPHAATAPGEPVATQTEPGVIMGTVTYMSPEQVRGQRADHRSDIFSFGLIVYEMLAGRRAFTGETSAEIMAAILKQDPPEPPESVPALMRQIVARCLEKDPANRFQSAKDLGFALAHSSQAVAAPTATAATGRKRALAMSAGVIACFAAGSALTVLIGPARTPAPDLSTYRFTPITRGDAEARSPEWAPDAKSIAYAARVHGVVQVFTRVPGDPNAVQLTKADQDCSSLFWSRDGATIFYISGGRLWFVPAAGGTAQVKLQGVDSAALHPDGKTLAFTRGRKLWIGTLEGGEPKEFWPGPSNGRLSFSPDGSKLTAAGMGPVWLLPYPSGTPQVLHPGGAGESVFTAPSWFPDSRHLVLAAVRSDTLTSTLSIIDVTNGSRRTIWSVPGGFNYPAVSPDGKRIAFSTGPFGWDVLEISIPGGVSRTLVSDGISMTPHWAPSGTHFIFAERGDVVVDRQAGEEGLSRRLGEAQGSEPQWSPDGNRFIVCHDSNAVSNLILKNAAGGGSVILDSTKAGRLLGISWSPDGQWISYVRSISGKPELARIRATPDASPEILGDAKPQLWARSGTRWSPAGDWIAYPAAQGIDMISPDGKSNRNLTSRKFRAYDFSKDGSRLYGIFQNTIGNDAQWQLFSVDVKTGSEKFLAPIDLAEDVSDVAGFSVHPDGKRFVTSAARFPFRIWMLEGFEQPQSRSGLAGLLRR